MTNCYFFLQINEIERVGTPFVNNSNNYLHSHHHHHMQSQIYQQSKDQQQNHIHSPHSNNTYSETIPFANGYNQRFHNEYNMPSSSIPNWHTSNLQPNEWVKAPYGPRPHRKRNLTPDPQSTQMLPSIRPPSQPNFSSNSNIITKENHKIVVNTNQKKNYKLIKF